MPLCGLEVGRCGRCEKEGPKWMNRHSCSGCSIIRTDERDTGSETDSPPGVVAQRGAAGRLACSHPGALEAWQGDRQGVCGS